MNAKTSSDCKTKCKREAVGVIVFLEHSVAARVSLLFV